MALGARRTDVLVLVLKDSLLPVAIGIVIGLPCAAASGRIVHALLFGITPADPIAMLVPVTVIALACLCAVFLPLHRALHLEPMSALKRE
jgi:ABC-type antimicrobial peptide transport system permease subunit